MSRARAAPPTQLFVEPINQTSVEVRWRHAIEPGEENPLSYEVGNCLVVSGMVIAFLAYAVDLLCASREAH